MTRATLVLDAGLLALPVLVAVLVAGLLTAVTGGLSSASVAALADIPRDYRLLYQQATADCPGLDWSLLAAIGKLESWSVPDSIDTDLGCQVGEFPES